MPGERERNALRFTEALKLTVEKRVFRLIQCLDPRYEDTIRSLSRFLGVAPTSFEKVLIARMDDVIAAKRVDADLVRRTDRLGPPLRAGAATATLPSPAETQDWQNLCRLAATAAQDVLPMIAADAHRPRLVVHLGLIARYELSTFLVRWLEACERDGGQAVFAVVPSEQGDDPTIDGRMPIPLASLGAQRLWVEPDWLDRQRQVGEG